MIWTEAQMSNPDVAKKYGVSLTSVSSYRNNHTQPKWDLLFQIAKDNNCELGDLFVKVEEFFKDQA